MSIVNAIVTAKQDTGMLVHIDGVGECYLPKRRLGSFFRGTEEIQSMFDQTAVGAELAVGFVSMEPRLNPDGVARPIVSHWMARKAVNIAEQQERVRLAQSWTGGELTVTRVDPERRFAICEAAGGLNGLLHETRLRTTAFDQLTVGDTLQGEILEAFLTDKGRARIRFAERS